jgi:subtilase family serine protease
LLKRTAKSHCDENRIASESMERDRQDFGEFFFNKLLDVSWFLSQQKDWMVMRQMNLNSRSALYRLGWLALAFTALLLPSPVLLAAQVFPQPDASSLVTTRLTQPIDEHSLVTLPGTVHPLANKANDRGAAPDDMQLERMHMVLKRNSAQESMLKQLVTDMHTPGNASYHKWLTPAQFGQQFGPSDQDISTIETWLQSKGFSVTDVKPGKQTLEFSGNVGQFRSAFHAQIHKYEVNGETHYANSTNPQIPAALAPVVGGFVSLNNFHARNFSHVLGKASYDPKTDKAMPQWTYGTATNVNFVLAPGDFAVQYDLQPLYNAGVNGAGQTIAIINDSNINIALVNQFRTLFSLPSNPPQVIIDGNDPGIDGINNPDGPNGDSGEAYLDVEWSGAVAPAATVDLVIGADTAIESGLILAAEHAVYYNVAPVMSMSFGFGCESQLGSSNQFLNSLWEQAAAQGITAMVSSGDASAAGCDRDSQEYAVNGVGVSGLSSTPYNVAVGGTDFFYSTYNQDTPTSISQATLQQLATYWNGTPTVTPAVSIQGYIPEQPWNDSQYGLNIFVQDPASSGSSSIAGGSGGASSAALCSAAFDSTTGACTGTSSGYPKPAWQTGFGTDTVRDVPDVSLFAANGANASYYPVCSGDGDCQLPSGSGSLIQITGVGGTSASSPSFAAIMALVNQKYGRQGQADFVLYPLSKQFPAAFHDVANGSNSVPCNITAASSGIPVSPDCISVSDPVTVTDPTFGTATEGQTGNTTTKTPDYNAGAGYDLASGLGSVDANQLVTNWGNVKFATTTTTLTPSSTSFTHGTAITVSGSVTVAGGTPTGNVALVTSSTEPINTVESTFFPLTNGSFSNSNVNFLPGGTYNIWGQYSGDGTNGASTSQQTPITVTPESSGIFFNAFSATGAVPSGTTGIDYGTQLNLSAQVTPGSQLTAIEKCQATQGATCPTYDIPTGTVTFDDNGSAINTAVVNVEGDAEYNAPLSVGAHSIVASYSGDSSYQQSTTTASTYTVVKDTPAIAISAASQFLTNGGQALTGQINTFNVQVANGAQINNGNTLGTVAPVPVAAPTGTVTVTGFPSGVPTSGTLTAGVVSGFQAVQGIATIAAPANTPAGNYNVTVSYSGDANYNATSLPVAIAITSPATVAGTGTAASVTTATASMNSTSPTASITITGTVTGQSGQAPTGGVLLYWSGNVATELGLTATSATTSSFSVVLNSQNLSQGANFVTLQYTGDSTYAPSDFTLSNPISNPLSDFSIVPQMTAVQVPMGSSATDIINATAVNGFSGPVSFICTPASGITCTITSSATLSPGSSTSASSNSVPLTLTINAGSSTPGGSYNVLVTGTDSTGKFIHTLNIQAVVSGSSAAASFSLTPNPGAIAAVSAGSSGTSAITVAPTNGFIGTVNLTCAVGGGPSGATNPTCSLSPTAANLTESTGTAGVVSTLTVGTSATTTAGSYTVTVTGTSGSITETAQVTITVNSPVAATFTLASTNAAAVSSPGGSTTSTISVNSTTGFTGNVSLTCAVTNMPSGAVNIPGCSLSPTTATVSTPSTLTITTTSSATAAVKPGSQLNRLFAVGGGLALAGLLFFGIPARRRSWSSILGVLLFGALAGVVIGCGSSNTNGGTPTGTTGTTTGAYVVTVTGTSGSITQATTVSVTVN